MTLVAALIGGAHANRGRLKWVAGDPIGGGSLVGVIEVQPGWVLCNGVVLPASGKTLALATLVGTRFGAAGQLPTCLDGRVPIPKGATNFPTVGVSGGEITHIVSLAEYPNHTHLTRDNNVGARGNSLDGYLNIDGFSGRTQSDVSVTKTSSSVGGGGSHNNMAPYQVGGYVLVRL